MSISFWHMPTTDDYESLRRLTDPQLAAIDVILAGGDRQSAAKAAGVHRVTVSKWANHHPEFKAELNRRRAELAQSNGDLVRRIDELVLGRLIVRIEAGDDAACSEWVKLRSLGKIDTASVGPTDAESIIRQDVQDRYAEVEQDIADVSAESALAGQPHTPNRVGIQETIERELVQRLDAPNDEAESASDQ